MIHIVHAKIDDLKIVKDIAYETWPVCYAHIISNEQMNFMLNEFYSLERLSYNLTKKKHQFLLAIEEDICLGFASYEHNYRDKKATHLHKIYILPRAQGKGIGLKLMHEVEDLAKKNHADVVSLNVNKYNKAQDFYKKNGYKVVADEVIDIGHGFVMDDYRMEKEL